MAKKHSFEYVKEYIENLECELLSKEYLNTATELEIKCKCGEVFKRKFKTIQKSPICKCKKCTKEYETSLKRLSYEDVKKRVENEGFKLITLESEYANTSCKIKIECPKGHITNPIANDFFRSHNCKRCSFIEMGEKQKLSYEDVKNYIESFEYKLISQEYDGNEELLEMICDKGHCCEISYHNFKSGHRCKTCGVMSRTIKQTIPYESRKIFVESEGYKLLTEKRNYINGEQKVLLSCPKGHEFEMSMHCFQGAGYRCPHCNESKGEKKVLDFLTENNIKYVSQYRFDDCKCKRTLPFDFYLPDYNICIEYDGKQHFLYGGFGSDLLELMNVKYRDNIKTVYCKKNDIKLIRISYWDFDNVEEILKNKLLK